MATIYIVMLDSDTGSNPEAAFSTKDQAVAYAKRRNEAAGVIPGKVKDFGWDVWEMDVDAPEPEVHHVYSSQRRSTVIYG
jgi:hypothetical protein